MEKHKLDNILALHKRWLDGESDGQQANLQGANLRWADLQGADLQGAILRGANLQGAILQGANLREADLELANLQGANLREADLELANLQGADLRCANLQGANLRWAELRWANLQGANLDFAVCRMDFGGWSICVYADRTSIGCQTHPNESWLSWGSDSQEIRALHSQASAWWAIHGEAVKAVIRCVQAKQLSTKT